MTQTKSWFSWSTGKDSAFALHSVQRAGQIKVEALLSTVTADVSRVSMHSTRKDLLVRQSESLGIPLRVVEIPQDCSNEIYEQRFLAGLRGADIDSVIFGDLFLEDVRAYRERLFAGTGLQPMFPIWGRDTAELAREMIALGFEAYITCVDPRKLPKSAAGRKFDLAFLNDLPADVDPCGENGEFHTFVANGPNFRFPIAVKIGEVVERGGFIFCDILPESSRNPGAGEALRQRRRRSSALIGSSNK